MSTTFDRVKKIVIEKLSVEESQIVPSASFQKDLGADSLDIMELIMRLEEEFECEIPDEDAEKIVTVEDVVNYVESHIKQ